MILAVICQSSVYSVRLNVHIVKNSPLTISSALSKKNKHMATSPCLVTITKVCHCRLCNETIFYFALSFFKSSLSPMTLNKYSLKTWDLVTMQITYPIDILLFNRFPGVVLGIQQLLVSGYVIHTAMAIVSMCVPASPVIFLGWISRN